VTLRVGIVGVGVIGHRRAQVVANDPRATLVMVADTNAERADSIAAEFGCKATTDWHELITRDDIDVVVVSVFNTYLGPIAIAAARARKHVLCEKPLGRSATEAAEIVQAFERVGKTLKVGFNLRFHPGLRQAHDVCADGRIGRPLYVRAAYGHGGRPGYELEWRGNRDLAGGGELLDQGVHIADLCRWFLGEFDTVAGRTTQGFWNAGDLEDNGFALLWAKSGVVATFHTSWMQWKNRFLFEVIATAGYATVDGLGGSYGPERLTIGLRRPEGGPPEEETVTFDPEDPSWRDEWREFVDAIEENREPISSGADALRTMQIIDAIYAASAAPGGTSTISNPPVGLVNSGVTG